MAQFSDLPQGATILPPKQQYSDLPQGASVIASDTPPTSGPIGVKVPEPQSLIQGGSAMDNALGRTMQGINGAKKELASTAQSIHNSNYSLAPKDNVMAKPLPFSGVDTEAHSPDEQAGKFTTGLAMMGIPMGEGNAMEGVKTIFPSADRAGAKLSELSGKLSNAPVALTHTVPALDRAAELSDAGGGAMGATGKLLNRSMDMNRMNFPEARDFYSNISGQSALDKMGQSPSLKRQVGNVRSAFHQDLASTADKALPATEHGYFGQPMNGGRGDYENAMGEYGHAKNIEDARDFLLKRAAPLLGGAGVAYEGIKRLVGK